MNTSLHDLMEILLRLHFLELDWFLNVFVTKLVNRFVNKFADRFVSGWTSNFYTVENVSSVFRISLTQSGIRASTIVFTNRSTGCFGRKETRRTLFRG